MDFTKLLNLPIPRKSSEKLKKVGKKRRRKKDTEKESKENLKSFEKTYKDEESVLGQAFEETRLSEKDWQIQRICVGALECKGNLGKLI